MLAGMPTNARGSGAISLGTARTPKTLSMPRGLARSRMIVAQSMAAYLEQTIHRLYLPTGDIVATLLRMTAIPTQLVFKHPAGLSVAVLLLYPLRA